MTTADRRVRLESRLGREIVRVSLPCAANGAPEQIVVTASILVVHHHVGVLCRDVVMISM